MFSSHVFTFLFPGISTCSKRQPIVPRLLHLHEPRPGVGAQRHREARSAKTWVQVLLSGQRSGNGTYTTTGNISLEYYHHVAQENISLRSVP